MQIFQVEVDVIGGGLAGTETALFLAKHGIKVNLFDIKPNKFSPAHKSQNFAELVCSNSLKSDDVFGNASGLLKEELRLLGSECINVADKVKVPAGNALAVDREKFSCLLTQRIREQKNITIYSEERTSVDKNRITVIATGPLSTDNLNKEISNLCGERLSFFDASAPIVSFESIDMDSAFFGDRYGKGNGDHINCPLNKEEYNFFISQLISAERADLHSFEDISVFEGCMPIEIMAGRGNNTLRFGPLKPTGLDDPKTGRWPYAVLQLRREDENGSMYNLVGFQTNLKFGEQKRVFGIIPALKNAEYLRYGVMHKNTFINSTKCLRKDNSLINCENIFFAGQITGVEGYVESMASGLYVGINIWRKIQGKDFIELPKESVLGALTEYITTENKDFQPMNANFGILPPLEDNVRDKAERKRLMAERGLSQIKNYIKEIEL